ncbi:MAG: efflux RND transporter periplasmic adaptor subunit [Hyphomicrobiaceae bacterium]|nr:efflux RND transporter periplasmic adaptor subunit [Hyphomicrobiaceae bacterium]
MKLIDGWIAREAMTRSYWIAGAIALAVVVWMASGIALRDDPQRPSSERAAKPEATQVAIRSSRASAVTRLLLLQGEVRAARTSAVPAETSGRVKAIYVREGQRVALGDRLLDLTLEARIARQREAEAQIAQLSAELSGARTLSAKGYAAEQRVQKLEAALATAQAGLARIQEEIADTEITAPYDGIVNNVAVEHNQYVAIGAVLATMVDNSILRVGVDVAQQDIASVERGREVRVEFPTGTSAWGRICFISASAAPKTRTFLVEIWVPNREQGTPSGISADVRLPLETRSAHLVSAAVLSLDDKGRLGIKAVDEADVVQFHPSEIVRSTDEGVWVAGAPASIRLITTGQGFVRAGERVRAGPEDEDGRAEEPGRAADAGLAEKLGIGKQTQQSGAGLRTADVPTCEEMRAAISPAGSSPAGSGGPQARRPP